MKVEINIDPERIDYDEINKTIIKRLENIPQDELLKELFSASDKVYFAYDDEISTSMNKIITNWIIDKITSSFNDVYCDSNGKLTTNGKNIMKNSIEEGFRSKIFSIVNPIIEDPEFKNIIIDFIRNNSGAILYKLITENYISAFSMIEASDMERRADIESKINSICSRLGVCV